ncbi:MAG: hypothetical protein ABR975_03115 [Vulcanimicrobiaceae bacterium]
MPPIRRPGLSALLVAGALVLLVSILIGQRLGDRVIVQSEQRAPIAGLAITPVPEPSPTDEGDLHDWKRLQVVSVATDPAFPDPRVTKPPTPTPKPTARPTPSNAPRPTAPATASYTSPPLPVPIASHSPDEGDTSATEPPVPGQVPP